MDTSSLTEMYRLDVFIKIRIHGHIIYFADVSKKYVDEL